MEEDDGAWMARKISYIDDAALSAIIDQADLADPVARSELERVLRGRRDKILRRYLLRLSSLTHPTVKEGRQLCVEDRAEAAGLGAPPTPTAQVWLTRDAPTAVPVSRGGPAELCVSVPNLGDGQHVLEGEPLRVVGLERLEDDHAGAG
jgi:hypothetical protein